MTSNWTTISVDDLKASALGFVVDRAQTASTGSVDPVEKAIAVSVARVRRAIASGGNALDADANKVPNSLEEVTIRLAIFILMGRLRIPLSSDQANDRDADKAELATVADPKIATPIETPDTPAGLAEMEVPTPGPRITPRCRRYSLEMEDGV